MECFFNTYLGFKGPVSVSVSFRNYSNSKNIYEDDQLITKSIMTTISVEQTLSLPRSAIIHFKRMFSMVFRHSIWFSLSIKYFVLKPF